MGLFSRKPKEYVFDYTTGCAVCRQSVQEDMHREITFYNGPISDGNIALRYFLHDTENCCNPEFIARSQPLGTTHVEMMIIPEKVMQGFAKHGDRIKKQERRQLESKS